MNKSFSGSKKIISLLGLKKCSIIVVEFQLKLGKHARRVKVERAFLYDLNCKQGYQVQSLEEPTINMSK
jgi:hypothetical protein